MKAIFQKILSLFISVLMTLGFVVIPEDFSEFSITDSVVEMSESETILKDGRTVYKQDGFSFTVSPDGIATIVGVTVNYSFPYWSGKEVFAIPDDLGGFTVKRIDVNNGMFNVKSVLYLTEHINYFHSDKADFNTLVCFSEVINISLNCDNSFKMVCFEGSDADEYAKVNDMNVKYLSEYNEELGIAYYVRQSLAFVEYITYQTSKDFVLPDYIDGYKVVGLHCNTLANRDEVDITSIWLPDSCSLYDLGYAFHDLPFSMPRIKCNQYSNPHGECYTYDLTCDYTLPDGTIVEGYNRGYNFDYDNNFEYLYLVFRDGEALVYGWRVVYQSGQPFYPDVKHITIPDTIKGYPVTYVGGFYPDNYEDTGMLETITFPDTVTTLGDFMFCSRLKEIDFTNIEIIEDKAFAECGSLKKPVFGKKLKYIGDSAFECCGFMGELTFPIDCALEYIGQAAFYGCFFSDITLPYNLKTIGSFAFRWSSVDKLVLPPSVEEVGTNLCYADDGLVVLNPDMKFPDADNVINEHSNIYGYVGSTAEAYAEKYGYNFIEIEETEVEFDGKSVDGDFIAIDSTGLSLKSFLSLVTLTDGACFDIVDETIKEGSTIPLINNQGYIEKCYTIVRLGDFNCDETVSVDDLVGMKALISGVLADTVTERDAASVDFNMDGVVNSTDLVYMKSYLVGNY
ncbi:MAG: leucine-rich repeat protein [Clostridia bacterium]|nr:leucine-rich repeat protein [Clostridia bacterium]